MNELLCKQGYNQAYYNESKPEKTEEMPSFNI